jgi:protein-L-isoaspartate O-methyltransferase
VQEPATESGSAAFDAWVAALEARHLADLRTAEVTRALRALSSAYVERRQAVARGATLDSAGKRAAFGLFYAPLHFLVTAHIVRALGIADPPPHAILDLGCGTGVAGAAWALAAGGTPAVTGLDRHPWAVQEAKWTYQTLGLRGQARQGDASRLPALRAGSAVVAAYVLNEMGEPARLELEQRLIGAAGQGVRVLIVEPIARSITPWWAATAARVVAAGGRADEWQLALDRPPIVALLDKAAGLNHREMKVRTLYAGPR